MSIVLPTAKVQKLKDVEKGSLISIYVRTHNAEGTAIAIRAERAGDHSPVAVAIEGDKDRRVASLVPAKPDTDVLVHGRNWSLDADPRDWVADFGFVTFGNDCSGLLLIGDEGKRGLVVSTGIACCYLNLDAWTVHDPNSESYVRTGKWNIAIPSNGPDETEWLFPMQ